MLRLSVNMWVYVWVVVCMVWIAISIAFNYALRIFWCHDSLSSMCMFLLGLYSPNPVVSPTIWPSEFLVGGMNDPYVYMHW